ncbi:hypothetical protein [Hymenobacter rubidus]|uniref:hypothetical protein n=1 Tax=Hymenobacter rubidus TaxID=1441626 RepID=UPI00191CA929|nr:hypothetical protein [Hymenobacter rubidus]
MRLLYSFFALTSYLVAGNSVSTTAQTLPCHSSYWYAGVKASYHQYAQPETVHGSGNSSPYLLKPAQVLVGYRFSQGQSVEVSFMKYQREAPANSNRTYLDRGDYYYYSNEAVEAFAISALLAVPLVHPSEASHWQLDGRIGGSYVITRFTEKYYNVLAINPGITYPTLEERRKLGDLPLTLGLAGSYIVGSHLAVTADASAHVSWILCVVKLFGTSGSPVGGGGGIGLRYNL